MSEFGAVIKQLRNAKGWSQGQLAVYSETSQPTVNQIETGKRNPSTETLEKLARALEVEVADLFPKAPRGLSLEPAPFDGVEEWMAAHGHKDEDQFRDQLLGLDLDIDEGGRPRGLEEAIAELRLTRDRLLEDLKRPVTRTSLFPRRSGLPTRDERIREALRPAKEAWELEWEIRHEYLAREIELINHGRRLLEGATEYEPRLEELLEAAYAQASAA
ncbi:MAG TPA: helix-turn-helix transcriptional regulator [Rubrobacter sp.]|nr:helix-turn-helix transcriptional regulator [Rubrobacter sp.]